MKFSDIKGGVSVAKTRMNVSNKVMKQRNKGKISVARFNEAWPTLTFKKQYGNRVSFDCDLCHGQFYLKTSEMKGCPKCNTYYTYLVYLTKYDVYKVGFTKNINTRLSSMGGGILLFYRHGTQNECAMLEYKWLKNLKDYLVRVEGLGGGTETFKYTECD